MSNPPLTTRALYARAPAFEMRKFVPLSTERVQHLLGARYTVARELGAGGTSIVFLAHDRVRGHPVAVKVLRPELSVAVVATRFLREIEIGQQLAHPNALQIYEYGLADGELYCTMPFIDGETLRQRLMRETHLTLPDTLRIARAVADALDYAHRLGVIHRDIKPANILLDHDRVVVADFGMARAMTVAATGDLTESGLAIGTARYMSPEQGSGERVLNGRTDVYSLACVVYEMLAGEAPFTGPTPQAIIARHCQEPPRSLRVIRPSVPSGVQRAVEKGLAKVPADRFDTAGEFLDALEAGARGDSINDSVDRPALDPRRSVSRSAPSGILWIAASVASLTALAAGAGWWRTAHAAPPASTRFTIESAAGLWINENANGFNLALSPDGQSLAFFAGPQRQLYVRHLDQLEPIPLPKTSGATDIHFSADGKWLAYMAQMDSGGPTKIPVGPGDIGAKPTRLSMTPGWSGMTWNSSPDVVYSWADTLWRVPAVGGKPRMIAGMDPTVDGRWEQPTMMPDGKTLAFVVSPRGAVSRDANRLAFISIGGGPRTLLDLPAQSALGYVDGALLFSRFTLGPARIMAVRFDLARRKLLGKPVTLMDGVPVKAGAGALAVVADNGTLAYLGRTAGNGMIQIVDEHGAVVGELPELVGAEQMVWSPDGQHIAMFSVEDDKPDIWVYDVTSRARKQITRTGGWLPAWTPDGTRIGFIEWGPGGTGGGKAMWVAADGGEPPVAIPGTSSLGSSITQVSFTSDGKYAVVRAQVRSGEPAETPHVLAVPLAGGPPLPTGVGGRVPSSLAVSPDGQWIAYAWNKAGRTDVYVSPFLGRGGEMQLSTDGGSQPRWSADGRKLVYRAGRGKNVLLVATLDLRGARPRLVRSDSLVFEPSHSDPTIVSYAVHPDGKRFLVARNAGETKLFVVTNWMTEVRAKLDGK